MVPCNCEGFRGVSQSLGHHISNDTIRDYIIGTREFAEPIGDYDIALIGDYNIGGDAWASKKSLRKWASTSRPSGPATARSSTSPLPIR
ncbi:MAG: nitrogenase component 1 [Syntrophotaleaceae bacterium]